MGAARREAIKHGIELGAKVFAYTELEKVSLIPELPKFAKLVMEGASSLLLPARQSMDSYPELQKYSETLGNAFWHKLTGLKLDLWFGPRIFDLNAAEYFLSYQGEYGDAWDSIIIPVMRAVAASERVASAPSSYIHPEAQRKIEDGSLEYLKKRLLQLTKITSALEIEWQRLQSSYSSTRSISR